MNDLAELADLARCAMDGDGRSYEALVRALWPNAYRVARSILGERGAAEGAAQAACAAICAKLHDVHDVRAFAGWAYRIIVSHARDLARARARLQRRETVGYDPASGVTSRDDPSIRLDLDAAIGALPETLRLPLGLAQVAPQCSTLAGQAFSVACSRRSNSFIVASSPPGRVSTRAAGFAVPRCL